MSSKSRLHVDFCSYEAAKYAVEHWYYRPEMPAFKTVRLGAWEDGQFIGVVIFGSGANPGLVKPYGLKQTEGAELVRIAMRSHNVPVSRILRIALLKLKEHCPGIRLVVTFADPEHHHGGVYQANGWIYAGMTVPADEFIVNGERRHGRGLRMYRSTHPLGHLEAPNVFEWTRRYIDPNVERVTGTSKHRYLYPFDKEMRERLQFFSQPYPKKPSDLPGSN